MDNQRTYRIALAGNPNTGKSTLFNLLTGLRQHTGNWPGKTVSQSKGYFDHLQTSYEIIDLPGTYSLFSNSLDEEIARNYIAFEKPDITIVVLDSTSLERNLNIALQVMEITNKVVICLNLIDEAEKKGIHIDEQKLRNTLGVPVLKISARNKIGIENMLNTISDIVKNNRTFAPINIKYSEEIENKISTLQPDIEAVYDDFLPSRWIALRLLEGDESVIEELNQRVLKNRKGGKEYEFASGE